MKSTELLYALASPLLLQILHPQLFVSAAVQDRTAPVKADSNLHQDPIMNVPVVPLPAGQDDTAFEPKDDVIISDVIQLDHSINIFAGFTRDIESVATRLDDGSRNTTVLAPSNSAIKALPRKPWEDPRDYSTLGSNAYSGSDGADRAHRNLRRFVEAHIIPTSPWKEGEKIESLVGRKIWWETRGGKKTIQPGNIEVSTVANRVANGELWIIKGVINYA
ncbi:hypothetical protein GP486_003794 [Trichoglossum hirsutum]|uniref:FAS1 domain-containing protein n=1 Tax=Trichoglossum hirsutum TaxID=265104 RepID=A0A9P8LCF3_9PEZI|nr:hypothetical protein GP486_003794 [Trichoglossum hirsutum]